MISDEKIKAVKKQLRRGEPAGEIRAELEREGYSAEDIEQCFKGHEADMRSWYLVFGFAFFIIGVWMFFRNGGLLFFIFSAAMFYQYYMAEKKAKKIE